MIRYSYMPGVTLRDYQVDALRRMKNGCILNGGVGSGKSRTALGYYYKLQGGEINSDCYVQMINPIDLYIITTARKRDTLEWEEEMLPFRMSTDPAAQKYTNKIVVDSWNNIQKYIGVENAFFIFDEQRVVGYGKWTKSFLAIAAKNQWILLSATPGDTWHDYIPVFIANGFFRNKYSFEKQHVVYSPWTKFPKVDKYINEGPLLRMKQSILIDMDYKRETEQHHNWVTVDYDKFKYKKVIESRWNPYTNAPIKNSGEYCYVLRHITNENDDRLNMVLEILEAHPKAIIFYSFDYELELLRNMFDAAHYPYSEWNGHKHQKILSEDGAPRWVYLVEYLAGAEGWNCTTTDTIIFFSQQYSYKIMVQASGRIDRMNTPYKDLYYFHLKSMSSIDVAIMSTLRKKKNFNERRFAPMFTNENNSE